MDDVSHKTLRVMKLGSEGRYISPLRKIPLEINQRPLGGLTEQGSILLASQSFVGVCYYKPKL